MKTEKTGFKFKVDCWEYERGWGSKVDSTHDFDSYEEAEKFIEKFNSDNTEESAPDWYMVARRKNYNKINPSPSGNLGEVKR